jgi:hypothetical protein
LTQKDIDLDDALMQVMHEKLEKVVIKEVCETHQIEESSNLIKKNKKLVLECNKKKNAMMELLDASVKTQRLYFVLRSIFMGLISAFITFTVILYLGTINFAQAIFLGIFVFTFSLMFSRLFDIQIVLISMKIIQFLEKHEKLKTIILRTF